MLFRYENKIYVRPFANRIVEVEVSKKGNEYFVNPTKNKVELTNKVANEMYSITIEEAYVLQNQNSNAKKQILE